MTKKNELSVWTLSYGKSYYLTHPWKLFRDFYWNFRNWWHRGRYGFAYVDVWEWSTWWPKVGAAALKYMAKHGSGYPSVEPWDTPEKWRDYLNKISDLLKWSADSQDILYNENINEYSAAMNEICERTSRRKENEDGTVSTWLDMTVKDKIIRDKYFAREKELQDEFDEQRAKIFEEIGHKLPRFWD